MSEAVKPFLPQRPGETDDEQRFREAMNRLGGKMLGTLDAALSLRTADHEVQRERHLARAKIKEACVSAMHTFAIHSFRDDEPQTNSPRR